MLLQDKYDILNKFHKFSGYWGELAQFPHTSQFCKKSQHVFVSSADCIVFKMKATSTSGGNTTTDFSLHQSKEWIQAANEGFRERVLYIDPQLFQPNVTNTRKRLWAPLLIFRHESVKDQHQRAKANDSLSRIIFYKNTHLSIVLHQINSTITKIIYMYTVYIHMQVFRNVS